VVAVFLLSAGGELAVLAQTYDSIGQGSVVAGQKTKVKSLPALVATAAIPAIVDPTTVEAVTAACQVEVRKGDDADVAVKKAKGRYSARLYVLDPLTSTFSSSDVGSGRIKTDASGAASFALTVSTDLLGSGFASGDLVAWVAVELSFTNGKKATRAALSCNVPAGDSGGLSGTGDFYVLAPVDRPERSLPQLDDPGVAGISFRFSWKSLEPAEGVYELAPVLDALDAVEAAGKRAMLRFHSGTNSPDWLFSMVEMTDFRGDPQPVPWDPVYLEKWHSLLSAVAGALGDSRPVTMVHVALTGPGSELQAPPELAGVVGVEGLLRDAYGSTFEVYRDAFSNALISLNVARVFTGDEIIHQLISDDFRATLGPRRAAVQVNVLRQDSDTGRTPWPTLTEAAAEGTHCGAQMGIIEIGQRDFATAVGKARDAGCAQWLEIYEPQVALLTAL
jgi:hypothetical protein